MSPVFLAASADRPIIALAFSSVILSRVAPRVAHIFRIFKWTNAVESEVFATELLKKKSRHEIQKTLNHNFSTLHFLITIKWKTFHTVKTFGSTSRLSCVIQIPIELKPVGVRIVLTKDFIFNIFVFVCNKTVVI